MPILDVELVGSEEPAAGLAQALADSAGAILGSAPGGTWVRLRTLPSNRYAENASAAEVRPVFVTVLQGSCPAIADRRSHARELAAAVARLTGRPGENVHVLFEPEARGRIAFGGELRE